MIFTLGEERYIPREELFIPPFCGRHCQACGKSTDYMLRAAKNPTTSTESFM
jgi:hypothetical protein